MCRAHHPRDSPHILPSRAVKSDEDQLSSPYHIRNSCEGPQQMKLRECAVMAPSLSQFPLRVNRGCTSTLREKRLHYCPREALLCEPGQVHGRFVAILSGRLDIRNKLSTVPKTMFSKYRARKQKIDVAWHKYFAKRQALIVFLILR